MKAVASLKLDNPSWPFFCLPDWIKRLDVTELMRGCPVRALTQPHGLVSDGRGRGRLTLLREALGLSAIYACRVTLGAQS